MGRPQPRTVHDLDVARDAAPGRRSEFHPPAGRGIVGLGPQLSGWTEDSCRAHDPRWRLRPGAHAAVRGRHQLRWHGVARGCAVGELLRITRRQDRDLPGPREGPLTANPSAKGFATWR